MQRLGRILKRFAQISLKATGAIDDLLTPSEYAISETAEKKVIAQHSCPTLIIILWRKWRWRERLRSSQQIIRHRFK